MPGVESSLKRRKVAACILLARVFCFQPDIMGPEDWEQVWDNWRLLTMAGIFDCWEPPEGGDLLYSYAIITVDASPGLNDIHQRQVVILIPGSNRILVRVYAFRF